MRQLIKGAAIAAAMTTGITAFAQGETPDYTPVNLSFRIGAFFPFDDNLDDLGNTFFAAGVDYRIDRSFFPGGETYFSLDWFGRSTSGVQGNVFPLCVNQKWFSTGTGLDTTGENRAYFFLGVGAFFIDVTDSDTVIGIRGGLGLELGQHFFAEACGYASDKANGNVRATGVGAYLGYRF